MPAYLLLHRHNPEDCRFAYAAWHGFDSPLRHHDTLSSCLLGDHRIIWTGVEAETPAAALAQLPPFVADRTDADPVRPVAIP